MISALKGLPDSGIIEDMERVNYFSTKKLNDAANLFCGIEERMGLPRTEKAFREFRSQFKHALSVAGIPSLTSAELEEVEEENWHTMYAMLRNR